MTLYFQTTITEVLVYTLFFDTQFSTYLSLQNTNKRDSLYPLLSTSKFFIHIPTLNNIGGY